MSASVSDKITDVRNAARPNSARVSSNRSAGGTSLACDNLTGWPTASKVHFVTYRIDSNSNPVAGSQIDCYGIVSGNTIGSLVVVDGTDSGNAINDIVEMLPTAAWGQDLADGLTAQHTRAGAHKSITNTGGLTTDTLSVSGAATLSGAASVGGNLAVAGTNQDAGIALSTYRNESQQAFVASGGVWTGDSYASTLAASMTALVCYINGQRGTISAVTSRAFTASKDTYIDVLNTSGVFTLVYTEVSNNAASPALAANSLRLGIVVSGGSSIAAATSINQGQPSRTVPTTCNVGSAGIDSLGNKIRRRTPFEPLIFTAATTTVGSGDVLSITLPLLVDSVISIDANMSFRWSGTPAVVTNHNLYIDGTLVQANRIDPYVSTASYSIPANYQKEVTAGNRIVKSNLGLGGGSADFTSVTMFIIVKPI